MAYIVERTKADGTITYQVKWREGGGRTDPGQTEKLAAFAVPARTTAPTGGWGRCR